MWRAVILLLLPGVAMADSVVATRTLRAQALIGPQDITLVDAIIPGAVGTLDSAVGFEARVTIYAGRPVRASDIGPPAIVDRNQLVTLSYQSGTLAILSEGRALARGGVGDVIRVMNLSSRTTISGRISADGSVQVGPNS